MAKNQENHITILLGLEGNEVGKAIEQEGDNSTGGDRLNEAMLPTLRVSKLLGHRRAEKRKVLHGWRQGKKI
ncbi:MAG: hypothetical protein E3J66_04725 [Dehalococcoidia bacterium]|nr:MAG: hypothetical protein E3J66_04725 [Dehalococcoidia bacterium]